MIHTTSAKRASSLQRDVRLTQFCSRVILPVIFILLFLLFFCFYLFFYSFKCLSDHRHHSDQNSLFRLPDLQDLIRRNTFQDLFDSRGPYDLKGRDLGMFRQAEMYPGVAL